MTLDSSPDWHPYPLAETGPGRIRVVTRRHVWSPELGNARDLLVALPPDYADRSDAFPVVYMQDGQNLFDPATSFAGTWGLVAALNALAREGVEAIVVGIPNRGRRRRYEYSPFRDILHGGGGGEKYLAFVVETVKPLVDGSFRTRAERAHTAIAGSSLGGSLSLYALDRHPAVFGAAAALSPALWFARGALLRRLERTLEAPAGRVYLDVGTEEGEPTLRNARALRELLLARGYREGYDLRYVEEEGGGHDEAAWGRRFREGLPWLLGTEGLGAGGPGAVNPLFLPTS